MLKIDTPEGLQELPPDMMVRALVLGALTATYEAEYPFVAGLPPTYDPDEVSRRLLMIAGLMFSLEDNMSSILGGEICICQTEEDLKVIEYTDMDFADKHDGRWPNVTEGIGDFDVAEQICPTWAVLWMATNNSGGPTYLIPRELWEKGRILEQIAGCSNNSTDIAEVHP